MTDQSVGLARGILRNAAALLLVGVFAKGMGLIIAILIARFLGASAMGLFAMLFAVAVLVEMFISIGMSDSLVRDVAAQPAQAASLFQRALALVLLISVAPTLGLMLAAIAAGDEAMRASLVVVAIGVPVSGAFVVSQAVLQGTERVLLLTWVTFLTRTASLLWLLFALYRGAGVEAAFVSRLLFQAVSVAVFCGYLWRRKSGEAVAYSMRDLVARSVPFALNRAAVEVSFRLPSLVLPATLGLVASGVFDVANRIRSTLGMTVSAAVVGLMPSFARHFASFSNSPGHLVGFSAKYMCLVMSGAATVIVLGSNAIIGLLFGPDFTEAATSLRVLAWVQVLAAVDAILQQALLASGREYVAVRHSAIGLVVQLALIVPLALAHGLTGVTAAVLLSVGLMLALDLRAIAGDISTASIGRFVSGPLAATGLVSLALFAVSCWPLWSKLLVAGASWAAATILFRLLPPEELRFMRRMIVAPYRGP
ncbi:MAG: hypothetical protein EPO25_04935 [Gammaproteobacteria bacterium]|nr:MAG: hypothetical protein EPO25_04935 [Gammaproteobacteria bacterium]